MYKYVQVGCEKLAECLEAGNGSIYARPMSRNRGKVTSKGIVIYVF